MLPPDDIPLDVGTVRDALWCRQAALQLMAAELKGAALPLQADPTEKIVSPASFSSPNLSNPTNCPISDLTGLESLTTCL